ncbi:MAG: hypothetical protein NTW79_01690 [Candidatus Berkelbacteria bacterium]|nr:hypothetical protein [Candidatus Berkelbacteria bacterium]MCX6813501.1 hypothetical protein [Candidatus Azambacteria bacterium]
MKKLSKIISMASVFVLSLFLSTQSVFADAILPGQERKSPRPPLPNNQNELIVYGVVGGVIVLVVVVSVVVLIKIRKRNVNK